MFNCKIKKEKQKKINELDIVVTIRLNQLQYLEKGKLPNELSDALVFDSRNLDRLQGRIKELQSEKVSEKKLYKYFLNFSINHLNCLYEDEFSLSLSGTLRITIKS